jgi:Flp pilus assembly protein TadD
MMTTSDFQTLLEQGIQKMQDGDFRSALEHLNSADHLSHRHADWLSQRMVSI